MKLLHMDNLVALDILARDGQRFDLVELDGPYGAYLEGWDELGETDYIDHYAQRLERVRDILQPWGSVFVFGYPEGCAEIKSWAHRTGTLYLRRWLTWYKQVTAHKGRKVESILFFIKGEGNRDALAEFGNMLKMERQRRGWTLRQVGERAGREWWHRGGNLYFETGSGGAPSPDDLRVLAEIFGFNPEEWAHVTRGSFEGITDLDYISRTYPEDTAQLNDNGLRSKPVGLYLDLFRPVKPTDTDRQPRALILYGGSGNAAIAAEALGYDVTVVEMDARRVKAISARAHREIPRWTSRVKAVQQTLPTVQGTQLSLLGG